MNEAAGRRLAENLCKLTNISRNQLDTFRVEPRTPSLTDYPNPRPLYTVHPASLTCNNKKVGGLWVCHNTESYRPTLCG